MSGATCVGGLVDENETRHQIIIGYEKTKNEIYRNGNLFGFRLFSAPNNFAVYFYLIRRNAAGTERRTRCTTGEGEQKFFVPNDGILVSILLAKYIYNNLVKGIKSLIFMTNITNSLQ